jgi:hypothetical protein
MLALVALTFFPSGISAQFGSSDLNAKQAYMAVEAYRRGLITKGDLGEEAVTLSQRVPGLPRHSLDSRGSRQTEGIIATSIGRDRGWQ